MQHWFNGKTEREQEFTLNVRGLPKNVEKANFNLILLRRNHRWVDYI